MDWFGVGAAALGALGDIFGTNSAMSAQEAMLDKQIAFNRESMQNKHQWEVADLKAAGLNPLLSTSSPTGTLSAPTPASVPRMNLAQSAAALGQLSINKKMAEAAETNANASKINAEANLKKAENDTRMTDFHVGPEFLMRSGLNEAQINNLVASTNLSKSQEALNLIQKEWLPKIMEANLNEVQMKIATGYLIAQAQDYALRTSADAAMVSANANVMKAQSYDRFVANAEMLGVSEAQLNSELGKKAIDEAKRIEADTVAKERENAYNKQYDELTTYQGSRYVGAVLGNLNPMKGW